MENLDSNSNSGNRHFGDGFQPQGGESTFGAVSDGVCPTNNSEESHVSDVPPAPNCSNSDPFANVESLRLSQNFSALAAVKAVITTVAVRKPNRHEFVRVRSGSEWRFDTGCLTDKESKEVYLVAPALHAAIPGEVQPTVLVVTISRNSPVPFLWPITLPGPDGRPNRWNESALEAARHAEQSWLRVASDMTAGCYVPHVAAANLPDPVWPADLTLPELLRLAFRGRFIDSLDHIILRKLRGEV